MSHQFFIGTIDYYCQKGYVFEGNVFIKHYLTEIIYIGHSKPIFEKITICGIVG